jgi:hypothetical protein
MQANQVSGIDLPLKALVWQDAGGKTWLTYNEPSWIAERHGLGPDMGRPDMGRAVAALAALLHNVAREATGQVPERGTDARGSAPQITS